MLNATRMVFVMGFMVVHNHSDIPIAHSHWQLAMKVKIAEKLKRTWHSPHVLAYMGPLLTCLFWGCAIYFDYKVLPNHHIFSSGKFLPEEKTWHLICRPNCLAERC